MIKKLTSSELSTIQSNNGLNLYLTNLVKEQPFTKRSWLYEDLDADDVLHRWLERLSVLRIGSEYEKRVYTFDTAQLEKWGPQGGHEAMSELYPTVIEPTYAIAANTSSRPTFRTAVWRKALDKTYNELRRYASALRPAGWTRVIEDMSDRNRLESNSGWPDFARRNLPRVKQNAISAAESGDWKTYPAIALFRRYNGKTRLVWMYPMSTNLIEGSYFQVLQTSLMRGGDQFFAPWIGFDRVREVITDTYEAGKCIAATDFSETDAHFTYETSLQVVIALQELFQRPYWQGLQYSVKRMHEIPLIIGPDAKCVGMHGVSSGSNWTNFIETIFDKELANYVSIDTENQWRGLYAIGDDMCWVTDKYDDAFSSTIEKYGEDVGQLIKAEKATNEPDYVKTLQRLFQRGYKRTDGLLRGVYPTIRALKSSIYPERFHDPKHWSSDMFCARQFMILENCVDHPLFRDFCKFVVGGSKYLKPFAHYSSAKLNKIQRETKLLPGLNPTYNQEKGNRPLSEFESVKLVRTL